ncbi:serine/threonine-protein kinase 19 isoform X2 [Paramormyrops kingsleyae]|uniref:Serine/threonine kinase 19 n=1 Tax=Paramormyrops kingsleyae TaxID=1676925 RepID=A0A3B3T399_9TELE|nr:serine/threonine-protein kinase 19 isoform X2 [Paramormyrops kingsleyae]
MNRKRTLIPETFTAKKWKSGSDNVGVQANDGPFDIKAALESLMSLFNRKLFNDTLPRIVLQHQLYSLHGDRTSVDRQLNELREKGEVLVFQMGFDAEAVGVVFTEDYREKVLAGEAGRATLGAVEKFLNNVLPSCPDMSFNKDQMLQQFFFTDAEITQLVKCGVLTVKDAGSWWLAIPNSGRFTKHFIQGRKAVLGMIKKSRYNEILMSDLERRQTTSQVKFQMKYHIHDIIGAEMVNRISTTSGVLLRFVES